MITRYHPTQNDRGESDDVDPFSNASWLKKVDRCVSGVSITFELCEKRFLKESKVYSEYNWNFKKILDALRRLQFF